jgi:TRAP-type uncharacterized transport system substrate-binding protein
MTVSRSFSDHLWLWLLVVTVAAVVLAAVAIFVWFEPRPPRVAVMTTGPPGSDFGLYGLQYQRIFRSAGVELKLVPSAGALENLQRLNDPRSNVSIGFTQGGLTTEAQSPGLESLGTMFFEPFWAFTRVPPGNKLEGLRGRKLAVGPVGSGARALAMMLLRLNGVDQHVAELQPLSADQATTALLRGEIDAAVMVSSWDSAAVRQLLASPDLSLVSFPRADAYVALFPYLSKLLLPAGVGSLAYNRPSTDVSLLAPRASLLVRRNLHPAIQYLLLQAATQIHSGPNIFRQFGRFPAAERDDLPLSSEALEFYKSGTPFLQRYLPFWLAVLVSRLLLLLVPLFGVLFPLLHFGPTIYRELMHRRVYHLYAELKLIEAALDGSGATSADALARLQRLQARASRMRMPSTYSPLLYQVRAHIGLVQGRLTQSSR